MAGRGKTTFEKRRKEQVRLERREQKAARKLERKVLREGASVASGDESQQPPQTPE